MRQAFAILVIVFGFFGYLKNCFEVYQSKNVVVMTEGTCQFLLYAVSIIFWYD